MLSTRLKSSNQRVTKDSGRQSNFKFERYSSEASVRFDNIRIAHRKDDHVLCTIVVDAEEDFDWIKPVVGIQHSVSNMLNTRALEDLAKHYGAGPTYLLTYPLLESSEVVASLKDAFDNERCDLGVQLHTWVNPPFDTHVEMALSKQAYSFAGNLPAYLEAEKLMLLTDRFEACFGIRPSMYRSGRYGLGYQTPELIESMGFVVDTSLSPRTDFSSESGPNFANFPYHPFWFGKSRPILELPLCREIVGWTRSFAPSLYRLSSRRPTSRLRVAALLSSTRTAERITLSPEGNDLAAMKRLVQQLYRTGLRTFVISFHSSSLVTGLNPYVNSPEDLNEFYDRLSGILDFLRYTFDARLVRLRDLPSEFY